MKSEAEKRPQTSIDEIWLRYINRYAYEHGAISETEYHGIERRIIARPEGTGRISRGR